MKEKIILFDLDGTLIDSTDAIVSTFYYTFEQLQFDYQKTQQDIKNLIGYPLDIMYANLGVEESRVWDFVDAYKARYKLISKEQTFLLEDAKESLEYASKFARLSVVTTKTGMYSVPLLEHMDILKYFEVITGREHVENPKPHEEPILRTLDLMKIDINKSDIWMIGDTKLDLISAQNAKVNSVAVLCGYGEEDELLNYTKNVVNSTLDAVKLISEIN